MRATEVVVFDENENFVARRTPLELPVRRIPGTAILEAADDMLPQLTNGAVSGWTYFNLNLPEHEDYAMQAWVIASMRAEGQFSVDMDAVALANGCTPAAPLSEVRDGPGTIGPP